MLPRHFRINRTSLLLAFALVVSGGIGLNFLFRTTETDNPSLGLIYHTYRWGKRYKISVDSNRDGKLDGWYMLDPKSPVDIPTIGKESSRCDGVFDIEVVHDSLGGARLSFDADRDGKADQFYQGNEATAFLHALNQNERKHCLTALSRQ